MDRIKRPWGRTGWTSQTKKKGGGDIQVEQKRECVSLRQQPGISSQSQRRIARSLTNEGSGGGPGQTDRPNGSNSSQGEGEQRWLGPRCATPDMRVGERWTSYTAVLTGRQLVFHSRRSLRHSVWRWPVWNPISYGSLGPPYLYLEGAIRWLFVFRRPFPFE